MVLRTQILSPGQRIADCCLLKQSMMKTFVDDKNIFQLKRDSMLNAYNKDFDSSSYSAIIFLSKRRLWIDYLGLFMLVSAICLCNLGMQNSRKRSRNRSRNSSGRKYHRDGVLIYIFFGVDSLNIMHELSGDIDTSATEGMVKAGEEIRT